MEATVILKDKNKFEHKFAFAMWITVLIVAAFMFFFWLGFTTAKQETYNREMNEYYESKIQEAEGQSAGLDFYKAE